VKNRVLGIFPSLLNETVFRLTAVFDETVTVCVAIAIDPFKCALDVGPNRFHESPVARPLVIRACQHHKKRRRVYAPVVAPEGHFTQDRHFIIAEFM
jgi:hypothetical protein